MLTYSQLQGQMLAIDQGTQIDGIWCFPLLQDENAYKYLPNMGGLGTNEAGKPEFSFLRYVINTESESSDNPISQADGGAILHFLISYYTDPHKLDRLEDKLKAKTQNELAHLSGPIIFEAGTYFLISSILNPQSGKEEKKLMVSGNAPVLEGSKLAFSFDLNPEDSKLLLESFKMATPDISITFDLQFSGLSEAYNAQLKVNWDDISKSENMKVSVGIPFFKSEVEKTVDDLFKSSSVEMITNGEDERMDELMEMAYEKITKLIFQPLTPFDLSDPETVGKLKEMLGDDGMGMLQGLLNHATGGVSGIGGSVGYKKRELRNRGTSQIDFKKRQRREMHHFITFNIGDLYKKYGKNERYFKTVNLMDPDFMQREVYIGVDGGLIKEFDKMVDNVSVTMRKKHQDGTETIDQKLVDQKAATENRQTIVYPYLKDVNRTQWLTYDFQTQWYFKGGGTYKSEWSENSSPMINLFAPYQHKTILLEGDLKKIEERGYRAVVVKLKYGFFEETKEPQMVIRTTDDLSEKSFEITLPTGVEEYEYSLNWIGGSEPLEYTSKDSFGIIFLDEFPNENE